MADITIDVEPPKPITVNLAGQEHSVRPIKGSLGMALAQKFQGDNSDMEKFEKSVNELIQIMFGKKDAATIKKRLQDPEDLLDLPHIFQLLNALVEKAAGNPTT